MSKEQIEHQEQFDFCTPEEAQEAIERNKKLAESGFDIREAKDDEPKPIKNSITIEEWKGETEILGIDSKDFKDSNWENGYWRMFNIVKDLIEEIKFLKG